MSISNRKIDAWTSPVVSETDRPTRTAAALKAVFDSNANQIKTAYNALIDDLSGTGGAAEIGAAAIDGLTGATVQDQIESLNTKVFGIVQTDEPANRFLNGTGQYSVPTVGAAANGLPIAGSDNDFLLKNGAPDYAAKWSGAAGVRTLLNVADGADVTATQIGNASAAETLADTDHFPVYSGALKKTTWSGLKAAIKAYLDTVFDYVTENTTVTTSGQTWYVKKWRSGYFEARTTIDLSNDDAITPGASNGGYAGYLGAGKVYFPYTVSSLGNLTVSPMLVRLGFVLSAYTVDTSGITDFILWSPVNNPFAVTGQALMAYVSMSGVIAT